MADAILHKSPFYSWLGATPIPSHLNLSDIRVFLQQPCIELSATEKDIEQLRRNLEELTERRKELVEEEEQHRAILHPHRRLPNEILQEIFLQCLDQPPRWPGLDAHDAPLSLAQVCQGWRMVALNTPQLWDRLRIVPPHGSARFLDFCMEQMQRWFATAGDRSLTVALYDMRASLESEAQRVVQAILPYASRIRSLDLTVSEDIFMRLLDALPSTSWPRLERLAIAEEVDTVVWDGETSLHKLPVWEAPLLKSVEWTSVEGNLWDLPLKWGELEEIQISVGRDERVPRLEGTDWIALSSSDARATLHATPNLRTLRIPLSDYPDESPPPVGPGGPAVIPQAPLVLSHLTTLDLIDVALNPAFTPVVFLHDLQLPALTILRYSLVHSDEEEQDPEDAISPLPTHDAHPLVHFLREQKSPILIRAFKIHTRSITRQGLIECLKMMSLLERLWVQNTDDVAGITLLSAYRGTTLDETFLAELSPDSRPGAERAGVLLCPCLASLRLDCIKCEIEDVTSFVNGRSTKQPVQLSMQPARHAPEFNPLEATVITAMPIRRISLGIVPYRFVQPEKMYAKWKKEFAERDISANIRVIGSHGPNEDEGSMGVSTRRYDPYGGVRDLRLELTTPSLFMHDFSWV